MKNKFITKNTEFRNISDFNYKTHNFERIDYFSFYCNRCDLYLNLCMIDEGTENNPDMWTYYFSPSEENVDITCDQMQIKSIIE